MPVSRRTVIGSVLGGGLAAAVFPTTPATADAYTVYDDIAWAESHYGIPNRLLLAMAFVESGRRWPDGGFHPWPWTLNIAGRGRYYDSRRQALADLHRHAADNPLIDVGVMQVNIRWHLDHFGTYDRMIAPRDNIVYAGWYLADLAHRKGNWTRAVASYHANKASARQNYLCLVMDRWSELAGLRVGHETVCG
ncbi:MAG: transglycosylase SLT domain-containing protein [Alphaproteobacteria bacterium]